MLPSKKKKRKNAPGKHQSKGKKEKVVLALCREINPDEIPEEEQPDDMDDRIVFECPMGSNCSAIHREIWSRVWKRKSDAGGYSNPYSHLKNCLGGEDELLKAYDIKVNAAAVDDQPSGGTIESFLSTKRRPVSQTALDCYEWILLIVEKDVPLGVVEDETFRRSGKPQTKFSIKRVSNVIRVLTELVETLIAEDIKKCRDHGGKAAIVHDGWSTDQNEHYLGLFLSFCIPIKGYKWNAPYLLDSHNCTLGMLTDGSPHFRPG